MPLPKSSSIAAKATEVYSEAWSVILQQLWSMPPSREDDLSDLSRLLPYLRQLLTCCACAGLLEDAMISLSCGHCYCFECQFRDPLLKIQCRQCRDRNGLVIETQLRILVKCYRHMCGILADKLHNDPELLKHLANYEHFDIKATTSSDTASKDVEKLKGADENCSKESLAEKSTVTSSPDNNPIVEILKEIQEGVKVSRAVLVIKPPQKYLAPKVSVTPKKDQQPTPAGPKRASDHSSESITPSNAPTSQDTPESDKSLISHRISHQRGKRKHGGRKSVLGIKKTSSPGEKSPVFPKKRRRVQRQSYSKMEVSTEEEEEVDVLSVTDGSSTTATESDLTRAKLALDCFQPHLFSVSLSCLDERCLDVTPDGVSLKQNDESDAPSADVTVGTGGGSSFDREYLRFKTSTDGRRERLWDLMCPSAKARRSRTVIDKTLTQQIKAARGAVKSKPKEIKPPRIVQPQLMPPLQLPPHIPPVPMEYEPPLPDDLSGLVLDKLEGDEPLPFPMDGLLFHPPPIYPPHLFHPLPPPPHFAAGQPPLFGPMHPPDHNYPLVMNPAVPIKHQYTPVSKSPSVPKKRRTPGYSEDGWRCRCGTNNVMFPEKVCAKGKCPCFSKGIPCKNCLCRHCHNPNNK